MTYEDPLGVPAEFRTATGDFEQYMTHMDLIFDAICHGQFSGPDAIDTVTLSLYCAYHGIDLGSLSPEEADVLRGRILLEFEFEDYYDGWTRRLPVIADIREIMQEWGVNPDTHAVYTSGYDVYRRVAHKTPRGAWNYRMEWITYSPRTYHWQVIRTLMTGTSTANQLELLDNLMNRPEWRG